MKSTSPLLLKQPTKTEAISAGLEGVVSAALNIRAGERTHAANIDLAHDILTVIFAATPIGPYIPIHKEIVGLASHGLEGHLARKRARRIKRNVRHAYRGALNRGQHELFAARYAAARVGLNPELAAPLLDPIVTTIPAQTTSSYNPRTGKTTTWTRPAYDVVMPDPRAESPFYDPETGAVTTERALVLKYGEGAAADAAREAYYRELVDEFARRPAPGRGLVPQVFQRLRR